MTVSPIEESSPPVPAIFTLFGIMFGGVSYLLPWVKGPLNLADVYLIDLGLGPWLTALGLCCAIFSFQIIIGDREPAQFLLRVVSAFSLSFALLSPILFIIEAEADIFDIGFVFGILATLSFFLAIGALLYYQDPEAVEAARYT